MHYCLSILSTLLLEKQPSYLSHKKYHHHDLQPPSRYIFNVCQKDNETLFDDDQDSYVHAKNKSRHNWGCIFDEGDTHTKTRLLSLNDVCFGCFDLIYLLLFSTILQNGLSSGGSKRRNRRSRSSEYISCYSKQF